MSGSQIQDYVYEEGEISLVLMFCIPNLGEEHY